jgi:hypothetical protein
VFDQRTVIVIAKKSRCAAEVEIALKDGDAGESFRSIDPLKTAVE